MVKYRLIVGNKMVKLFPILTKILWSLKKENPTLQQGFSMVFN